MLLESFWVLAIALRQYYWSLRYEVRVFFSVCSQTQSWSGHILPYSDQCTNEAQRLQVKKYACDVFIITPNLFYIWIGLLAGNVYLKCTVSFGNFGAVGLEVSLHRGDIRDGVGELLFQDIC